MRQGEWWLTTPDASSTTPAPSFPVCTSQGGASAARVESSAPTGRVQPKPVSHLLEDFDNGKLARELAAPEGLSNLLARGGATPLTWEQWQSIDAEERRRGGETARPRVKFIDV